MTDYSKFFSQKLTFTRGEVAGAGVALLLLGLYAMHQQHGHQQQAYNAGCVVGFGMGVRSAQAAFQQRQGAAPQQLPAQAQQQSDDGAQLVPYDWSNQSNAGMGGLSYIPEQR